ncbi:MAG: MBL fold metallo-hydrolase [Alphaproteobacteria bacterium]|nr:MAG: MBL fold metallo-hydrolase [Alphaproteobacteria bacterium]
MYLRIIGSAPGESVVIVFDCGSVITIDCCQSAGRNHTLDALNDLGVDPRKVIYNIITHFHDDHIKGAADLINHCPNSKVVIPDAWTEDVFKMFVATVSDDTSLARVSVTKEIEKIFNVLQGHKGRLFTVSELTSLYPPPAYSHSTTESLIVLTPTAARKAKFLSSLAADIEDGEAAAYAFCESNKNWTSICCVLRYGGKYIFLGGDVENFGPDYDLTSIHKNHLQSVAQYELVKLPHHGSSTSFCDELRDLIHSNNTIVALTPYPRGHKALPSLETVAYLHGVENVYVLAGQKVKTPRNQRMRRSSLVIDPVPKYRPGVLDFMDGQVDAKLCEGLESYIQSRSSN